MLFTRPPRRSRRWTAGTRSRQDPGRRCSSGVVTPRLPLGLLVRDHLPGAGAFRVVELLRVEVPVHLHGQRVDRSEEHTSELQSRENLVCRLLLEKKNSSMVEFFNSTSV